MTRIRLNMLTAFTACLLLHIHMCSAQFAIATSSATAGGAVASAGGVTAIAQLPQFGFGFNGFGTNTFYNGFNNNFPINNRGAARPGNGRPSPFQADWNGGSTQTVNGWGNWEGQGSNRNSPGCGFNCGQSAPGWNGAGGGNVNGRPQPNGWGNSAGPAQPGWGMQQPGWGNGGMQQPGWGNGGMQPPGWGNGGMPPPGRGNGGMPPPGRGNGGMQQPGWGNGGMQQPGWGNGGMQPPGRGNGGMQPPGRGNGNGTPPTEWTDANGSIPSNPPTAINNGQTRPGGPQPPINNGNAKPPTATPRPAIPLPTTDSTPSTLIVGTNRPPLIAPTPPPNQGDTLIVGTNRPPLVPPPQPTPSPAPTTYSRSIENSRLRQIIFPSSLEYVPNPREETPAEDIDVRRR